MSAVRTGEARPTHVPLAGDVFKARRDVREAEQALQESPGYMAALKVQILKRHWQKLRAPKAAPILDKEWDDESLQPVDTVIVDRDPGDER